MTAPDSTTAAATTTTSSSSLNTSLRRHYAQVNASQSPPPPPPPAAKRPKSSAWEDHLERPTLKYADLGGIDKTVLELRDLVHPAFERTGLLRRLGGGLYNGVLMYGPPGCGKSALAQAIAGELDVALIRVASPEIIAGVSGESEARLRDLLAFARRSAPCVLFLDEVDAIMGRREGLQRGMEHRVVTQLLTCLDDLAKAELEAPVLVLAATNRPEALDPALRRGGRFAHELHLGIPDEKGREAILRIVSAKLAVAPSLDYDSLARRTPGFVGVDLEALARTALLIAIRRLSREGTGGRQEQQKQEQKQEQEQKQQKQEQKQQKQEQEQQEQKQEADGEVLIEGTDFEEALGRVQPSARREGFATAPDVSWQDVGALRAVRDELRLAVVEPIRNPHLFAAVGIEAPAGILLWGPPGCGKTLLAQAVASESHASFISIKGPELLNKWVGQSELAVRQVFARARASAPCIIFFDEMDALAARRRDGNGEGSDATARVVNQLLTELAGLESRRGVYVVAATNRPDMIDPAMLRGGRLGKMLYVRLPEAEERGEILQTLGRRTPWAEDVDLEAVARDARCAGFSGADLAALVKEASLAAVKGYLDSHMDVVEEGVRIVVCREHVETAFAKVRPTVSPRDQQAYDRLHAQFQQ